MKKLILLFSLLTVFISLTYGQPEIGIRRIKIGNTYRETNQFKEAERNLISGLSLVQQRKDKYWEAVGCENLGLLYRELDDSVKAVRYFDTATRIYQQLRLEGSRLAMQQLAESMRKRSADLYAGVDIGSTGVKLSVLQVTLGREGRYIYNTVKDSSINANFADLNSGAFEASKNAMRSFMTVIARYGIPADRIFMAFSSGVLQSVLSRNLDRDSISTLFEQIVRTAMPAHVGQIRFLTADMESKYTNMGIVLPKSKERSVSIDIGGGNTKGGYYTSGDFTSFSLPFGSRTMLFSPQANDLPENVKVELKLLNQTAGIQNKREVFFLGGIVWAMINLLYPEKALADYVEFNYNDVMNFKKFASEDYNNFINYTSEKITQISDRETAIKAQKNLSDTENTFTAENLRKGSFLFAGMMNELNIPTIKKKYYFLSRGSHIAWVTGFIVSNISDKYRNAAE